MNKINQELQGMKILIVDDVPANIDVLRSMLGKQGFNISVAPSGEIALKIVSQSLPDLILLDVMMPGISGFDTCKELKNNQATQNIPIIFITAKTETKDIVDAFAIGAVDYIAKPFHAEEVFARVESQLRLQKLSQDKDRLIKQLDKVSRTDPLTGLSNRRSMEEKINDEKHRSDRSQKPFCLILSDIDLFKNINDTFGHNVGDEVLLTIANLMTAGVRKQDTICRWGGEEFLIILPDSDLQGGLLLAEKIRSKIATESIKYKQTSIPVTMSFGISMYQGGNMPIESYIKEADDYLYQAKDAGRNCVKAKTNI